MVVQKSSGGRSRGKKYLILVTFSVIFLVCIQLWVYKQQTWSQQQQQQHSEDVPGTTRRRRETFSTILKKSWFRFNDGGVNTSTENDSDLLEIFQALTLCKTSAKKNGQSQDWDEDPVTADCLMRLATNLSSSSPSQERPCPPLQRALDTPPQTGRDQILIETLENTVGTLSQLLKNSTVFFELKDRREPGLSDTDTTWFMSSVHGPNTKNGFPEELVFPSELSHGKVLCIMGNHTTDGTQNSYGFAWRGFLPPDSVLLPGLTLVADNYWDYINIWHSMSALVDFVSWRARHGCVAPERLLLFHWGELVPSMGDWIHSVLHSTFGSPIEVEQLDHGQNGPVCFEHAIVNRRGLGGMSVPNMNTMFETIRCRVRKFCDVKTTPSQALQPTHVTLLLRSGARAFQNDSAVMEVLKRVCDKKGDCEFEAVQVADLSFCEQVAVMSRTDVLITTHGAQMTNSMFMSKGSSVMELIPKGWLEFAGIGQYIYKWLADWSNLHHEGVWHDDAGPDCPKPSSDDECFLFHKDITVGLNETHLAEWTIEVIDKFRRRKKGRASDEERLLNSTMGESCSCDDVDGNHRSHFL